MRHLLPFLLVPAFLTLVAASPAALDKTPDYGVVEVQVLAGPGPLAGASVALDLNSNGVWDELLGEPRDWTDADGIVIFSDVVSIQHPGPGDGGPGEDLAGRPSRIMMGNLRGTVGAPEVQLDFVLPPGSRTAGLSLHDLRGRRIAQTSGNGELALSLTGGLPAGVYFLRLSADPAAPVSRRITSIGTRTQTVRATEVSPAEAMAAGWLDDGRNQHQKSDDPPHHVNLIVEHPDYPAVIQPEIIEPGYNHFTVSLESPGIEGFVFIPPGTFMMGSPLDEPGRQTVEGPQHQVTLTQGFYMATHEVTEELWHLVMGGTPADPLLPRVQTSWDMAVQFCNALSIMEGRTPVYTIHGPAGDVTWDQGADGYRLATEAEWEYACRAGSTTAFASGPITQLGCDPLDPNLDLLGWYCGNSGWELQPVALKGANAWGLHDMHGNTREWVWCGRRIYSEEPQIDPVHSVGPYGSRVMRGGTWTQSAHGCRSAYREENYPGGTVSNAGVRLVRTAF